MKTSNKILLTAISVMGLSILSILIFAKSSLVTIEQNSIKGNGKIIKVDYPIEAISMLEVEEFFEVYVTIGEAKLEIETDENIQALLHTSYDNYYATTGQEDYKRVLKVDKMNNTNLNPSQAIKLLLAVPTLEGIEVGNHATVVFEEEVISEKFRIQLDEFANAYLKLQSKELEVQVQKNATLEILGHVGDTNIEADEFSKVNIETIDADKVGITARNHSGLKLKGQTKIVDVSTEEFCKIDIAELQAVEAKLHTRNHSSASIYVTGDLEVRADEFSTVSYRGNPTIREQYLHKSATLEAIQE
jgi:2C-methyl-D-erythritol 2,4-cyclodiphosphate synthase